MKKPLIYIALTVVIFATIVFLFGGRKSVSNFAEIEAIPAIFPEYYGICIPSNIAPLNFRIEEPGEKFFVKVSSGSGKSFCVSGRGEEVQFPIRKWKKILRENVGGKLEIEIFRKEKEEGWMKYSTIENTVSLEELDAYLTYRKIHPGFALWGEMGIYERNLENFDERIIMENTATGRNCMNCHSFCKNEGSTMMFHMRAKHGGTYIVKDGEISKVNTKTPETMSAGVYPAWHPGGRYITFSVNEIHQFFHAQAEKRVEVVDFASDLILYDTEKNLVSKIDQACDTMAFETFPSWSPDGKYLYYCSAAARSPGEYQDIKYSLLKVEFDEENKRFGKLDTVISALETGKSISFPRVSPDGAYLMFCMSDYGNFSIWHEESDLYIYDIERDTILHPKGLNSSDTESYHTWSSSGKWVVFSSRRINGLYTRPYFAYHYGGGSFSKPFILPQKNPDFYDTFLKSYNIPELVKSPIDVSSWEIYRKAMEDPEQSDYESINN